MKISESDINREGFAVLHGKWGGRQGCIVGVDGKQISESDIDKCRPRDTVIGYLAYPNPKLKNDIPNSRFYKYDTIIRRREPLPPFGRPLLKKERRCAPSKSVLSYKTSGKLEQSVTKTEYIKKINQIKELLSAGEIYQMCYCIRFRKKIEGDPYALFLKLIDANPGDFSAYINCGKFQIISSSPERLFKVEKGKIITQPIKGTAPKGTEHRTQDTAESFLSPESCVLCPETDPNLRELMNSEKERAELDMITDLERNDVGKICKYGTLKLAKERKILELKNIWHTYSQVEGQLSKNIKSDEIIKAMFPGGSITGCPKKRAMKYIEELEGLPRNIFTGSIGYISSGCSIGAPIGDVNTPTGAPTEPQRNISMDFNICIRTALVRNGYIEYWAGGGIVADSNPQREYDECLLKAEKFLQLI